MTLLPTDTSELIICANGIWHRYRSDDADRPRPKAVYPGAFNPLHEGHRRIAQIGVEILTVPVHFEVSITNVDKLPLDPDDVVRRVAQFGAEQTVWITRAPTFVKKSRLFPTAVFLTGADTIARIGDARYYDKCDGSRDGAIDEIARQGCRFLVFGRQIDNRFCTLSDLELPSSLSQLCTEIPEERFRVDVSSTDLRGQGQGRS